MYNYKDYSSKRDKKRIYIGAKEKNILQQLWTKVESLSYLQETWDLLSYL